ncbi:EAL domain-containing protein [Pseudocolwellia sp. AS88]|uniref:bifunctional diguanylate cyclase/phosphodiesterase n=1 Tax=Pseudocolwellia sp. AS88 TaxID=3063958 RepID=UPI0026EE0DFB|nr:EAL domain-containing protein [Pseudocolwellia sp. AS88]MDO7086398.1 EAL domain-containing protein [Pseudocolwellia sp. AS88]
MKSVSELKKEIVTLRNELDALRELNEIKTVGYSRDGEYSVSTHYEVNNGTWDWDLKTNNVYYSASWKSILGYEEHELEPHFDVWAKLVHPEDKEFILAKIQNYLYGNHKGFEHEMRMRHKSGHYLHTITRVVQVTRDAEDKPIRLIGNHVDISQQRKAELFEHRYNNVLKMIAQGEPAIDVYNEIIHIYEGRHNGIRCSMIELEGNILKHGSAPSLPQEYCKVIDGLMNGPNIGSCGTSTYTGKRVIVEDIATDPKWSSIKHIVLPYGMRSCWSEPVISSIGEVLGTFAMYKDYPCVPNTEESFALSAAARLTSIVMERDKNQKRIKSLAYADELTGLANRSHLFASIKELISASEKKHKPFSLLYIDLDNFKSVNDSLGHDIGDYLLQVIAQRLISLGDKVDSVSRIGGDEFCVILSDQDNAALIAQEVIDTVSKTIKLSGRNFNPTCSVGIARYPDDGTSLECLLKASDIALYSAKKTGKNCFAFYKIELSIIAEYHFRAEQYLREAIEKKQLKLVYQPQVDIDSGMIVGVEALSRWTHSELGVVSPVEFIEMAERIGMIKQLTEWVLYEACSQGVKWHKAGFTDLRVTVNISPTHLADADFIPLIKRVIESTGMKSQCLELEITESVVQTNHEDFSIFKSLKELGVLLAIDDFGSGYSSFASLKYLTVDYIKIDKYFIHDMFLDHKTELLIGSMIEMGHHLGYKVIAEGVETFEQFDILKLLGCDIIQGYLFSKPIKPEDISLLLNDGSLLKHRS